MFSEINLINIYKTWLQKCKGKKYIRKENKN